MNRVVGVAQGSVGRRAASTLTLLVSLLLLAAALWLFDPAAIAAALRALPVSAIAGAGLFLLAGAALAGPRLQVIARQLGHRLSFTEGMQAMAVGQLGGALSFQFFGQIAARTALLRKRGIQLPANIAMTAVEKLAALVVSLGLAVCGSLWLFGHIVLQLDQGGLQLIQLTAGIFAAVVGGALLGWGALAWREAHRLAKLHLVKPTLVSIGYTIGIQICTAAAYVVAARALAPAIDLADLVAASFVIMFAASIPISFAGWGVRELSAVFALKTIGVPAGTAVAVAVSIGALALLVVVAIAGFSIVIRRTATHTARAPDSALDRFDAATPLAWLVPLLAATAIVMQLKVPTATGLLNLNPADPLALIGAALFWHSAHRNGFPHWRVPQLTLHVISMTAAVLLAFLIGLASFGLTDWAFFNRTLGWFVLLAYAATGALVFQAGGSAGVTLALRTFVGAIAGIIAMQLLLLAVQRAGLGIDARFLSLPLEGLSGNRNAFAFLIVMALACLPVTGTNPIVLGILGVGVWFTGSYAGIGAAVVVVLIALLKGYLRPFDLFRSAVVGLSIIAVLGAIGSISHFFGSWAGASRPDTRLAVLLYSSGSLAERLKSIEGGLALFLQHPIFGAGLGAYMDAETKAGYPLVIHSMPVWLLAEMGVVGFAVFAWFGWRITHQAAVSREAESAALLLAIAGFCTMAAVHDMMYQRSIWLLAGALLATSAKARA